MINPKDIERALTKVKDQASFLRFLSEGLHWPLEAQSVEDASYTWSEKDLRAANLDAKVVDSRIFQIANLDPNQKWGVFVIEFKHADAFLAERGMTGVLRQVLRGLVPSRAKDASQPSWNRGHLLFICTHNYEHFRFAYFKSPREGSKTAPLAAFGWGPDIPARTACEFNLPALEWPDNPKDNEAWIAAWSEAFNVEKVTKRFYTDYAAEFEKIRKAVKQLKGEEQKMFTQTLLNRLMFLRFIERKGWLTAPGNGSSRDYLRLLFQAGGYRGKSFFAGRLRKLFFEALAVEGKQESEAIGKVPFLNGGLFEETELDKKVDDIDDKAFAPLLGPEGLFYRYNFTVQESTPLDIEVAVDPEMLGKVFEELVTGRHESGSYYTPRPVVSFMCREALKGYLVDTLGGRQSSAADSSDDPASQSDALQKTIAAFVDHHDVTHIKLADARKIAEALDNVRAVDPACGSGAYLLGLLHEIVDLYRLLYSDKLKTDSRALHAIKLDIIQNCLYGVDIDPFATNIAMLRLWLSLTVDSDSPQALPNLDFKIETGDSVIGPSPDNGNVMLIEPARQLAIIKGQYMRARGEQKASLRRLVLAEQKEIAELQRSVAAASGNFPPNAVDWQVQFCEVFYPAGPSVATVDGQFAFVNKVKGRQQSFLQPTLADRVGFDIVLANPPYIRQELIKDLKPELKKVYGPLFSGTADLYVFFYLRALQLLAPGGMLVFISSNKWFRAGYGEKLRAHIAKTTTVQTILDFHDLPVFEAIAYPMIFIAAKRAPADSHTATLAEPPDLEPPYPDVRAVVEKYGHPMPTTALGRDGTWRVRDSTVSEKQVNLAGVPLIEYVKGRIYRGVVTGLNEAWRDSAGRVYVKGQKRPKDSIKHGVFVIDAEKRKELIAGDPTCAQLIKPLLTGRDIKRWRLQRPSKWLVFTRRGIEIEKFPTIESHLAMWKRQLTPRSSGGTGGSVGRKPGRYKWYEIQDDIAYHEEFYAPKIVFADIAPEMRFTVDKSGSFYPNTAYIIGSSDLFLLAVLNSKPVERWYAGITAQIQGGFMRFFVQYVEQIPIPTASPADQSTIAALAQKCLDARGVGCEAWEKEIDERVAALYGL